MTGGGIFDALDCAFHFLRCHIVEQDGLGAVLERFFKLLLVAHFYLHTLAFVALFESLSEDFLNAAAQRNVIVLDEDAGGEVDAVIGSSSALHGVFLQGAQAGHGLACIEHAGVSAPMCGIDGVNEFSRQRGDAAEVLQQVEDHALAAQQHPRIVADNRKHLALANFYSVEYFGMADDFKAGLRRRARVKTSKDFKEARDRAETGDDQLLPGHDGGRGAQFRVDGQVGGGVAGGLVFRQGLLQQCVDAAAFPVHRAVISD